MHQTPHTLEAMQLLKGRLTSGFVFLRGWFLMIWSLLVFFARGFRCSIGRVHSNSMNRLHTHTRGNRCRLLLLPTHRENKQFKCLLLISTQNDQHFYNHKFYSWKVLKKTVLTASYANSIRVCEGWNYRSFFQIKSSAETLENLFFKYLFI